MVEPSGEMTMPDANRSPSESDPEHIQHEIEQTRAEMSQTIDEIQERLSPEALKTQATDKIKEATIGKVQEKVSNATTSVVDALGSATDSVVGAVNDTAHSVGDRASDMGHSTTHTLGDTGHMMRDRSSGIMGTLRENPVPVAMISAGIGWMLMRSNRSDSSHQSHGPGPMQHVSSTIQDTAHNVQHTGGQLTHQVREQVGHAPQMARREAQDLRKWYTQKTQQNPMMLGVAALGLGALAGLLIPETERERQMMGERRDEMMDQVQAKAQDTMHKAQSIAEEVGENIQETVQESLQQQGQSMS